MRLPWPFRRQPSDGAAAPAAVGVVQRVEAPVRHDWRVAGTLLPTFAGDPGIRIQRFPDEMTIVLQNKYWDLKVSDHGFEVGLSFNQIPSHLSIPFGAVTAFVDPEVNFALHFQALADDQGIAEHEPAENDPPPPVTDGSNVVAVDFGRKK